jgi:3-oxoadipate enol-lactonase
MSDFLRTSLAGPEGAPVVVLLHPLATDMRIWSLQLPVLANKYRVIRVDLAGHGGSAAVTARSIADQARMVADTLRAEGISGATIVGLSLGGMVAQRLALDHQGLVRGLVIACSAARMLPALGALWAERIAATRAGGMEAQVAPTLARWFTPEFAAASPLTLTWVGGIIADTPPEGYIASCEAIRDLDQLDELDRITAKTLVIAGRHDAALPLQVLQAIVAKIPGARLALLDAAHLANVEQPVKFTELVGAFLDELAEEEKK